MKYKIKSNYNTSLLHFVDYMSMWNEHINNHNYAWFKKNFYINSTDKMYLEKYRKIRSRLGWEKESTLLIWAYNNFERNKNKKIKEIGIGKMATVMGRYYAMDRDSVWSRTKKAYDSMVLSRGNKARSFEEAIKLSYQKNVSDEFFEPTIILEKNKPVASIERGDGLIFFNFSIIVSN